MKNKIPINTFTKSVDRPGYTQSDTVAHCGTSLSGAFANTLTLTDMDSTWTENRALYGKKAVEIRKAFNDIEKSNFSRFNE